MGDERISLDNSKFHPLIPYVRNGHRSPLRKVPALRYLPFRPRIVPASRYRLSLPLRIPRGAFEGSGKVVLSGSVFVLLGIAAVSDPSDFRYPVRVGFEESLGWKKYERKVSRRLVSALFRLADLQNPGRDADERNGGDDLPYFRKAIPAANSAPVLGRSSSEALLVVRSPGMSNETFLRFSVASVAGDSETFEL